MTSGGNGARRGEQKVEVDMKITKTLSSVIVRETIAEAYTINYALIIILDEITSK